MKFPKILMGSKDSNIIFVMVKPESMRYTCACGKEWHYKDAVFCSACGKQLEEAFTNGSL